MKQTVDYHRYLASREWALKKRAVRERSGGICERCGRNPHKQTHHLTYERFGDELLEDLQGVCKECHEYLSAVTDSDPKASAELSDSRTLVDIFREWGARLPLTIEAFDGFNDHIQAAIRASEGQISLELLQIKLEVNQRIYDLRKGLRHFQ